MVLTPGVLPGCEKPPIFVHDWSPGDFENAPLVLSRDQFMAIAASIVGRDVFSVPASGPDYPIERDPAIAELRTLAEVHASALRHAVPIDDNPKSEPDE